MVRERTIAGHYLVDDDGLDVAGQVRLFSYAGSEKLLGTLRSGQIWLNPYSRMNDPREAKVWFPDMEYASEADRLVDMVDRVSQGLELDRHLRTGTSLACFTVDRAPHSSRPHNWFHRGWARARMWDQYAERHRGGVLIFDRSLLVEAIYEADAGAPAARRAAGLVEYVDEILELRVSADDLRARGAKAIAADLLDRRFGFDELFFRKNTDWESEREFRIVVSREMDGPQDPEPMRVSYGDALKAVVMGEDIDRTQKDEIKALLGGSEVELFWCAWLRGAPYLDALPLP